MSNLSELLPAGSSVKSADFVAQGTLASGVTVALRSDGKVEAIAGVTAGFGTQTEFRNGSINSSSCCYDTGQDKILIFYSDQANNGYMTMVVGTMTSGNSISFGTPVVALSESSNYCIAVFDPISGKSLVGGQATSSTYTGAFFAVTISGTTPSVGAKTSLFAGLQYTCGVYNTTAQKILVAGNENGNSNYAAAAVATISGTSVSFGSKLVWNSQDSRELKIAYDSVNNNNVCVFKKQANSWGQFGILVVSGTSVSVISTHTFAQASTRYPVVAYDVDKAKMLIVYQNSGSSSHLWYACVTLSGNSPTTGTAAALLAATGGYSSYALQLIYHPTLKKIIVNYGGVNSAAGTYAEVAISGTTATLGTPVAYNSSPNNGYYYASLAYNPDQDNILAAYMSENKGESTAFNFSSTNATSFIGITDQAISSAATGKVVCKGGAITNTGLLPLAETFGSKVVFEAAISNQRSSAFDSANNKIVIAYQDSGNSNYGTAIVGTVSGNSITFGTPAVFASHSMQYSSTVYDPDTQKIIISYRNSTSGSSGLAVVGTVSGTSISFGTAVEYAASSVFIQEAVYDTANNKVVITYDDVTQNATRSIVGTVSGTSISFGTAVSVNSNRGSDVSAAYDSANGKIVVAYKESSRGKARVGTVSGTSISFGGETNFSSGNLFWPTVVYDVQNEKTLIAFRDSDNSDYGTAVVGTVSGTSISFGSATVFNTGITQSIQGTYDSTNNVVALSYADNPNSNQGTAINGTISGTSVSFGSATVFNTTDTSGDPGAVISYDTNAKKLVYAFTDSGNSNYGTAIVGNLSNALTPNTAYFVQDDGTISTTSSTTKAGTALSTTSLLLTG